MRPRITADSREKFVVNRWRLDSNPDLSRLAGTTPSRAPRTRPQAEARRFRAGAPFALTLSFEPSALRRHVRTVPKRVSWHDQLDCPIMRRVQPRRSRNGFRDFEALRARPLRAKIGRTQDLVRRYRVLEDWSISLFQPRGQGPLADKRPWGTDTAIQTSDHATAAPRVAFDWLGRVAQKRRFVKLSFPQILAKLRVCIRFLATRRYDVLDRIGSFIRGRISSLLYDSVTIDKI